MKNRREISYDRMQEIGEDFDQKKAQQLCSIMKETAVKACGTKEEKAVIKKMTLAELEDIGLLCRVKGDRYPTHTFDLMSENHHKAAKIQCALFKGLVRDVFIDQKEFTGPIQEQVEDAYHFVLRHINLGVSIEGMYRADVYELPVTAMREMIVNAVLHRSYIDRSCIQLSIFDDRIEVLSSGKLYGGLHIDTAMQGRSICRNEAIAEAFHYMKIAEVRGTGIPRIISECREYGLKEPKFEELGDNFRVTMYRKINQVT